jgi:hypothetical protein
MAATFVSYARNDIKLVKKITREMHSQGLEYWMDTRNLQGGKTWPGAITKAISDCDKFLLIVSRASMVSDNVRREVQ